MRVFGLLVLVPWMYLVVVIQSMAPGVPLALPAALVTAALLRGSAGIGCAAVWGLCGDALAGGALGLDVIGYTLCAAITLRLAEDSTIKLAALAVLLTTVETTTGSALRILIENRPIDPEQCGWLAVRTFLGAIPGAVVLAIAAGRSGLLSVKPGKLSSVSVENRWWMLTN